MLAVIFGQYLFETDFQVQNSNQNPGGGWGGADPKFKISQSVLKHMSFWSIYLRNRP